MTIAPVLPRQKLPIGIQTFAKLREENCYYVDKTGLAMDLADGGGSFFLSRPRRFGKSLLLDTFKELFECNAKLFTGLAAEKQWDCDPQYPVIHISLGGGVLKSREDLEQLVHKKLTNHESRFDLPARFVDGRSRFADLIERLHAQTGQKVVVLVDEYDKPILDNII